ncbi:MAG: ABC transporter ATP-binding protein [Planctomycetota bacterium]
MSNPIIQLKKVNRYFDDGLVRGLDEINLEIFPGEVISIMGPSGSGKSTLLNIIGTLDFPSEGEFFLEDHKINATMNLDRIRSQLLGFIFQLHNLIPNLTLLENVMLPMMPLPLSKHEKQKRAQDYLMRVGLDHRIHFLPTKVSGGERQRAAIARGLVNNPSIILADEPTGSLDTETGSEIIELLLSLAHHEKKTLIIVTHNPAIAQRADRIIEIVDGKIVATKS